MHVIPMEFNNLLMSFFSRVYGTHSLHSDWDYIVVVDDSYADGRAIAAESENSFHGNEEHDCVLVTKSKFIQLINEHQMNGLECLWLPPHQVLLEKFKPQFSLDLATLRKATAARSAHSWSKAHKKFLEHRMLQ